MTFNIGLKENVLSALTELAVKYGVKKIVLFGSRARGDYRRTSDIDLAITGGDVVRFMLDAEELVPTLLKFDIVNLDGAVQKELVESIEREGVAIYEEI